MSPERPLQGTGLLHVITGLDPGGAELALLRLVGQTSLSKERITVISLTANGEVGERLAAAGAEVLTLGMARGVPDPKGLWRLTGLLRRRRPALVQSWMYHADLVAGLAARLAGGPRVVWNVRNGTIDPAGVRRMTGWTARVSGRLGRWLPARIVCCSRTARELHVGLGYPEERMVLIPNGFDLTRFRPDPQDRARMRSELGIPHDAPVVGCVGRFGPVKDHHGLVQAAAALAARHAEVCFVLCGAGVDPANAQIMEWVREHGLEERCRLLGYRTDLERVYRALDVLALSSYTEAFPKWTSFLHPEALAGGVRAGLLESYATVAACASLLGHGVDFWMTNRWGPHNSYVGFEISYGVAGLVALVLFYVTAFWTFLRYGNRRGMVFTVVAIAMQSLFMDLLLDHRAMLALICAAGCAEAAELGASPAERTRADPSGGAAAA